MPPPHLHLGSAGAIRAIDDISGQGLNNEPWAESCIFWWAGDPRIFTALCSAGRSVLGEGNRPSCKAAVGVHTAALCDAWCQTRGRESQVHSQRSREWRGRGHWPCDRPSRSVPALPWTFSFLKDVAVALKLPLKGHLPSQQLSAPRDEMYPRKWLLVMGFICVFIYLLLVSSA